MLVDERPRRSDRRPEPRPSLESVPLPRQRALQTLRLVLLGESLVDAPRLFFADRDEVDRFLRLNQFDTDNPLDLARLRDLRHEASDYLAEVHGQALPLELEQEHDIHELFLLASRPDDPRQKAALALLKVMHVAHHLSGRELGYARPISEADLFVRLSGRVFTVIDRMRAAGLQVVEFAAGKKSRRSLVNKLLAKRGTLASQVFDKARFAITVGERDELVPAVLFLASNLFSPSYVLPEQSHNQILTAADVAAALALPREILPVELLRLGHDARSPRNPFSGDGYRSINFVVDIPVRIDDIAPAATPAIAFVQAEIQLFDRQTAVANDGGESAHACYKRRQAEAVRARLAGTPDRSESDKGGRKLD